MLTIKYIKENTEEAIKLLAVKNFDAKEIFKKLINLDDERKKNQGSLDKTLA